MDYLFEPLDKNKHDRKGFTSGVDTVDHHIREVAARLAKKNTLRTQVLVDADADERIILGFHSLCMRSEWVSELPGGLFPKREVPAHKEIPVAFLSMLGIDNRYQGEKLGELLMINAMEAVAEAARHVGCALLGLDSLETDNPEENHRRRRFYQKFGFELARPDSVRHYLTLSAIQAHLKALD